MSDHVLKRHFYSVFGLAVALYAQFILVSFVCFLLNLSKMFKVLEVCFPYNVDNGNKGDNDIMSLITNLALFAYLCLPHSIFARQSTKDLLGMTTKGVSLYRSLYALHVSTAMHLLMVYWEPVWEDVEIWSLPSWVIYLSLFGAFINFTALCNLDIFGTFGLKQSAGIDFMYLLGLFLLGLGIKGQTIRGWYRLIRHPQYVGLIIGILILPIMTLNHMILNGFLIFWMVFITQKFEEPYLCKKFPGVYQEYQKTTPAFIPFSFGCPLSRKSKNYAGLSEDH